MAVITEEDHPYETGFTGKTVEVCPPGFKIIPGKDDPQATHIICSQCKAVVYGLK